LIATIYWIAIIAAVLINVTALTLIAERWIPFPATARTAVIAIICLGLFSLEHFNRARKLAYGGPATYGILRLCHLA
jgi:hypothetical protein